MKSNASLAAAVVAALVLAGVLRVWGIEERPFHHDEAINSIQAELLWQRGQYRYSPQGLHGPTLAYLTQPFLWASPADSYPQTRELTFRVVPLVFGLALVLLTFALAPGIGRNAAAAAAALCAVSPAMVFYSRYFIHEMPLALFGLLAIVCGWRTLRSLAEGQPAWGWALGAGASIGGMHATKETFVIHLAAGGLGFLAGVPWRRPTRAFAWHALAAIAAAAIVSVLFFSSFFSNAQGPLDSLLTFSSYLDQGTDTAGTHDQPWSFYLGLLIYQQRGGLLFTSEAAIALLAVAGAVGAMRGRGIERDALPLVRFFAVYTLAMLGIYSAIPYKTPWCLLGALHGMTVLAGVGVAALLRSARSLPARAAVTVLLVGVVAHLAWQNGLVNFRYERDERNPWVYSHALADVRRVADRVRALSPRSLHVYNWTDNASLYFYLRGVPGVRFQRRADIPSASGELDMILLDEADADALDAGVADRYALERFQLRPNIWARLYRSPALR